jgi:ATP-dependent helicase/nuclease subunit A
MSQNAPTPNQIAKQIIAADPNQSVWVGANAGTGKTRVLIDRILRLLLEGVPPTRILCLTFTKAASAEMATRLSKQLGEWAVSSDEKLIPELAQMMGRKPGQKGINSARQLFAKTIDAPGGLKIRTIHSFCESLLGRFPIEARVAPHFTVIDERTANELRCEARDDLMRQAETGESEIQKAFSFIAGLVDEGGFESLMEGIDGNRHHLKALLLRHGGVKGLGHAVKLRLGVAGGANEPSIIAETFGREDTQLMHAADGLGKGTAMDLKKSVAIRNFIRADTYLKILETYGPYKSIFITQKGTPTVRLATKAAEKSEPAVIDILLAEQNRILDLEGRLKGLLIAEATEALVLVGDALIRIYGDLKSYRALLDYDDLILKTRDLLGDGRINWVHYKLDGGIDHILVDEAQDTSPEQWEVIAALASDFFSGEGAGMDDRILERTIFAVGDQKQSIYSFQGADPAKFSEMRTYFSELAKAAERKWQSVELTLSFRSVWTILSTVDSVFTGEGAPKGLQVEDDPIQHFSFRDGQAGLVELWPTMTPDEVPKDDPWDAPLDQISKKSPAARLAEKIANTLMSWFESGEKLGSTGRTIQPGDVMILLRRRGDFAEEMVRQLKQRQIPVAGSDRMVLLNQMAIMDLVAVGRFALLPEDDLNTAIVLKSPFLGLDDDNLFDLAYGRTKGTTIWQRLRDKRNEHKKYKTAVKWLERLALEADFTPPFEFYARLLGEGRGRFNLLSRLGPDAADPIDEFLNLALSFERDHPPSLEKFLHWLAAGNTQIKRDLEHGRGEVRVMTVHGAKGLQANVVFLPDTCVTPDARFDSQLYWEKTGDNPLFFWPVVKDNEEKICTSLRDQAKKNSADEYSRLLYVALTRAQDRVYVCGWETNRGRNEGCWYDLVKRGLLNQGAEAFALEGGAKGLRLQSMQTQVPDNTSSVSKELPSNTAVPVWLSLPPPAEPLPPSPLNPSRPDNEDPPIRSPLGDDDGARFKRGTLIHRLLETIPNLPPADWDKALKRYLALKTHELTSEQQAEIATETLAVLTDPKLFILFGPQSITEVPLVGTVGDGANARVISAQIDRLVLYGDRIIIVDYKTNRPPPLNETQVAPQYLRQMALYRAALRRIYPDHQVEAVLLWTDAPRAMWLSETVLDPYEP